MKGLFLSLSAMLTLRMAQWTLAGAFIGGGPTVGML